MHKFRIFFKFLKFLKPYWLQETLVLFLVCLSIGTSLAPPYLTKVIIDEVFPFRDFELLVLVLTTLLALIAGGAILQFATNYLLSWVVYHIMMDIRHSFFAHLIRLPLSFHQQTETGDILYRLEGDVNVIRAFIASSVLQLFSSLLTIIGIAVMLCWLNLWMTLALTVVIPLFLLNAWYFQSKIRKIAEVIQRAQSELMGFFKERFDNIKLIQAFNGYTPEGTNLQTRLDAIRGFSMKFALYDTSLDSISGLLIGLTPAIVFGWGGYQVILGTMSVGAVVAYLQYAYRLFPPVQGLGNLYVSFVQTSVSMQRVLAFMDLPVEERAGGPFALNKKIAFKGVEFAYNGQQVLRGLDLEFERGKTYALIGPSGCGKSTVVDLLCRFCQPDRGAILVDEADLSQVDLFALRDGIGLVAQENLLLHNSIWENLRYGSWQRPRQEAEQAAKATGLDALVQRQEGGFEALVGEAGSQISGGQGQRIAIARALLKEADLLILDEATSALDATSEKQIFDHIRVHYADRIVLLISHRLSAIRGVDEILYLDEGRIVERGRHEELIALEGAYWHLFQEQIEVPTSG